MAIVEIIRDNGKLAIIEVISGLNWEHRETFGVLPRRPADVTRIDPVLTVEEDGRKVVTGQRLVNGQARNIAWWADDEEVARVNAEFAAALERSSVEVTDALLASLLEG